MSPPAPPPVRVLYVNHVGVCGGAEKSLLRLLEHLEPRQVEAHVAAPEGALAAAVRQMAYPPQIIPECRLRRPQTCWQALAALGSFRRYCHSLGRACRTLQPDLIHANSLIAAWAAVRVTRRPVIWHCRDLQSPPRVMQMVRRRVARVVAISQAVAAHIAEAAPQGAPVTVIYNGFSATDVHVTRRRSQVREQWEMAPETPLVGCMGQLVPWKRQDALLRAMPEVLARVPEARLVIMGSDTFNEHPDYVGSLYALAEELGVGGHVVWAGFVDHPADALAALDVLAHPAEQEPFGRVVLEAMALGVPVVAINRAGPAELIEHERSGLLAPPDDVGALAEAIVRLLTDDELRENISDGAHIRASHFTASATAARVVELYHEVLQR